MKALDYAVHLGKRLKEEKTFSLRWFYGFLGRWPELKVVKPSGLSEQRARCASEESISNYFQELDRILTKYDMKDKPHLIYNIDEKGINTEYRAPSVVAIKSVKPQVVMSERLKTVAVFGAGNALGSQIPPYFVFPGQRRLPELLEGKTPGVDGIMTPSGWSNSDVFKLYLKEHFIKWKQTTCGVWTGVIGDSVWRMKQSNTELFYQVYRNDDTKPGKQDMKMAVEKKSFVTSDIRLKSNQNQADKNNKPSLKEEETVMDNITKDAQIEAVESVKLKTLNCSHTLLNQVPSVSDDIILKDYFQLDINLENLYKSWAEADQNFDRISKQFTGIRILRQDPVECLFSFICSSNNHISRIASMVDKLSTYYGHKILELDGQEYFSFPNVSSLSMDGVEDKLRTLGFGYRAKYIQVADCVSLFCLDKCGAIPVDTHVWQIAARDYLPKLKHAKSLTDKLYEEIGDHFRSLWGPYAGWAHSVLFTADLRQFKEAEVKSPGKKTTTKRKTETIKKQNSTKRRKN